MVKHPVDLDNGRGTHDELVPEGDSCILDMVYDEAGQSIQDMTERRRWRDRAEKGDVRKEPSLGEDSQEPRRKKKRVSPGIKVGYKYNT
jgi:hypothetical protein